MEDPEAANSRGDNAAGLALDGAQQPKGGGTAHPRGRLTSLDDGRGMRAGRRSGC